MTSNAIRVQTRFDSALLSDREVTRRLLLITVTVPQGKPRTDRLPLNLALVIDRSGSMQRAKLEYVKQAACHVLDLLQERDQVAVVAYDDEIRVISPSVTLSSAKRAELKNQIRGLHTGGSTALFAGWMTGAGEVAEHYLKTGVNRALLLTDGLANVGESDPNVLGRHASELRERGVSTSTFGVGADYDHFLLSNLAERGGGQYHFIESPRQIPEMFQRELGELLSIEARHAALRLTVPRGVRVRLLGDLPHEPGEDGLRLPLGDLYAGREMEFLVEIHAPAEPMGRRCTLTLQCGYTTREGLAATATADATLTYAPHDEATRATTDQTVTQKAAGMEMAAAEAQALLMAQRGDYAGGKKRFESARACYAVSLSEQDAADFATLEERFDTVMVDPMQQKRRHAGTYARRQSRVAPPTESDNTTDNSAPQTAENNS